jgi:hypothetical protein
MLVKSGMAVNSRYAAVNVVGSATNDVNDSVNVVNIALSVMRTCVTGDVGRINDANKGFVYHYWGEGHVSAEIGPYIEPNRWNCIRLYQWNVNGCDLKITLYIIPIN